MAGEHSDYIFFDRDAPSARQQQIIAHEYGHTAESPHLPVDAQTAMLARLAAVSGLTDVIADGANRSVKDGLHAIAAKLPAQLNALAAGLDAAVTTIALSVRGQ